MDRVGHLTLAGIGSSEDVVRRSRFFGYAGPVADAGALRAFLDEVRARHPGVRHAPFAWIGADGERRASDDGEPSGTGGRPCLGALERAGVQGAAVAVARIFGGVLLGAANLGRAYGEAAAQAVAAAGTIEHRPALEVRFTVPYADVDHAERALVRAGARDIRRGFGEEASFSALVALDAVAALREALPRARWE